MSQALLNALEIVAGIERDRARGYQAYGTTELLQNDISPELLIAGPAGTGKSRAGLEKLNREMWEYPGARTLLVRKTRKSLNESGLFTLEKYVLGFDNPIVTNGPARAHRDKYVYPNGSEIVLGGMDRPDKIMSTEYDRIYFMEAIEGTETDWEQLITRLRNYVIPWQQIIGDTNPGAPTHWLKQREGRGVLKMLNSTHKDNPTLWDQVRQVWTARGLDYLAKLKNLSGVRRLRLLQGIWAAAEGAVYEEWDPGVHLLYPFEIPAEWRRFRVVDFGFTNPFVCQWWAVDPDGRMFLYKEIYKSQRIVADHAERIKEMSEGEKIETTVADHDAEDRATLARAGIPTKAATKAVMAGIQAVQQRLRPAGDGKPRLFILRDALDEVDTELEANKKPLSTVQEIDGYVWHKGADGKVTKEEPVKIDDHGCLVGDTLIETPQGLVRLQDVKVGDYVKGRNGFVRVLDAAMTQVNANIWELRGKNGVVLRGTGNHPIYTHNRGFIQIDAMRYDDIMVYNYLTGENTPCYRNRTVRVKRKSLSIRGLSSDVILTRQTRVAASTMFQVSPCENKGLTASIGKYTRIFTERFQQATRFIIGMGTRLIMTQAIWNVWSDWHILSCIKRNTLKNNWQRDAFGLWRKFILKLSTGIVPKRGGSGTNNTPKSHSPNANSESWNANSAKQSFDLENLTIPNIALVSVKHVLGERVALTTKPDIAFDVAMPLNPTNTQSNSFALVPVEVIFDTRTKTPVYNLTVEGGEYFANGILVHNCDAMRYAVAYVDRIRGGGLGIR